MFAGRVPLEPAPARRCPTVRFTLELIRVEGVLCHRNISTPPVQCSFGEQRSEAPYFYQIVGVRWVGNLIAMRTPFGVPSRE
jgi:hypothetical protein